MVDQLQLEKLVEQWNAENEDKDSLQQKRSMVSDVGSTCAANILEDVESPFAHVDETAESDDEQ